MPKTRVLVVDDAVVIRRILSEAITADPELELAGWASDGKIALARIEQLNPDCITLDVEMPHMDGIATLLEIRKKYPRMPVIMFSTLTEKGAQKTLEALARGATDYVTKPANVGSVVECIDRLRADLIPKIKAYTRPPAAALPQLPKTVKPDPITTRPKTRECRILCIGSSTGGPNALSELLPRLPADLVVPVVIVQHMPPVFTRLFAERLNEICPFPVCEGAENTEVLPGHVYIAPGGFHMELARRSNKTFLHLTEEPPENSCRPAADVLFRSVVKHYGSSILAVILTGMGCDGMRGCQHIVEAGGRVLAQDAASSVVWGMPGAVTEAGLTEEVLPLLDLPAAIMARLPKSTEARLAG